MNEKNRKNLKKLAAFLENFVTDEAHRFDMAEYTWGSEHGYHDIHKATTCGTAGCAAGWGPSAGIPKLPTEDWFKYSVHSFIRGAGAESFGELSVVEQLTWEWFFSTDWQFVDNSPRGAAARINWFLQHGLPPDTEQQRAERSPLCYTS